jgi:hypothetical protein
VKREPSSVRQHDHDSSHHRGAKRASAATARTRRVGGEAPVSAFRPVVSSPPPSEPDVRLPPHPALHEHIEWGSCSIPARAASAGCEVPARERTASVHRRAPSVQSCCVLTGPLRPVDGFPVLLGGTLLPRLLRVLRHAPNTYICCPTTSAGYCSLGEVCCVDRCALTSVGCYVRARRSVVTPTTPLGTAILGRQGGLRRGSCPAPRVHAWRC